MQKWARLLYQPALPLNGKVPVTGSEEHISISKKAADESVVLLPVTPHCTPGSPKEGIGK